MSEPYVRDFLRDIDQRTPQGAALLAFLAVAATAPAQVHPSDVGVLHTRYPRTRRVTSDVVRGVIDPDGTHDPMRGTGLGSVRPTGAPAVGLVYDRQLGVVSWVDATGGPTYAPPDYRDAAITIVGAPPRSGAVTGLYFAFAERQQPSARLRTVERLHATITPEAIAAAPMQSSPFDQCCSEDIEFTREERTAIATASRAVVARAIHETQVGNTSPRDSIRVSEQSVGTDPESTTTELRKPECTAPTTPDGNSDDYVRRGSSSRDVGAEMRGHSDDIDAVESVGQ